MRISEIFASIQGEGVFIGTPAVFIRTYGCNLAEEKKCHLPCDTKYAWSGNDYREMTAREILQEVQSLCMKHFTRIVVLTGGEVAFQDPNQVQELVLGLLQAGLAVHLETNASIYQDWMRMITWITASPKLYQDQMIYNNTVLRMAREIKCVITRERDFEIFMQNLSQFFTANFMIPINCLAIWFHAADNDVSLLKYLWENAPKLNNSLFRVGIQLHKYVHGAKRGV